MTGCPTAISISSHRVKGKTATFSVYVPAAGKVTASGKGLFEWIEDRQGSGNDNRGFEPEEGWEAEDEDQVDLHAEEWREASQDRHGQLQKVDEMIRAENRAMEKIGVWGSGNRSHPLALGLPRLDGSDERVATPRVMQSPRQGGCFDDECTCNPACQPDRWMVVGVSGIL